MAAASSELLRVDRVSKSFARLKAVNDVSFSLGRGKVTILIGPNGSGKTTLLNIISGFYRPDSGEVYLNSRRVTGWPAHKMYHAGLARSFQIPALFTKLTVLENLLVAAENKRGESFLGAMMKRAWLPAEKDAVERATRILEIVGLSPQWREPAANLSGGQMKLLEMGRALMSGADLLLLDEPISGVNPTLAHGVFDTILKLRDKLGITFLIVEHRLDIAMKYVDQAIAMAYGSLLASGAPQEVLGDRRVVEAYLGA